MNRSPRKNLLPRPRASARTSPREIDLHVDELILHGFESKSQRTVAEALQSQLTALLAEQGIPATWEDNPLTLEARAAHAIGLTNPGTTGARIADAIYHSRPAKQQQGNAPPFV
jgi:hypothetical protein